MLYGTVTRKSACYLMGAPYCAGGFVAVDFPACNYEHTAAGRTFDGEFLAALPESMGKYLIERMSASEMREALSNAYRYQDLSDIDGDIAAPPSIDCLLACIE